jgi:glutathione S-transferase
MAAVEALALLPTDPLERARVRALAAIVGCDIHPLTVSAAALQREIEPRRGAAQA